jgi:exodeoxyribonuclease (lambda-induced)
MKFTFNEAPQGSEAWIEARRGRITGSKFKTAREKLKSGALTSKAILYAEDVARERMGGKAASVFVNKAMNFGQEQEPFARAAYETTTGNIVQEVGFAASDCGLFGLSPDGLVGDDGVIEIKTMVGSDTLFTAVVDGDLSEYMDQVNGYLLFLNRQWVDLVLWSPDLEATGLGLVIHRIQRDEKALSELRADLDKFASLVRQYESKLRLKAAANVEQLRQIA